MICKGEIKAKAIPIQASYRPMGFQEVEAPRFHDNPHMMLIRLSALCTSPPFPPGNIPGTGGPPYPRVIRSKTYRGYVKQRIIPNAIYNVI
jgi:hypothetical protein